jgi:hypothetical protein
MDDLTLGNPQHPEHETWLVELGRATDAAALLATTVFDLLRIHGGIEASDMYRDHLGRLERRARAMVRVSPPPTEMEAFLDLLPDARETRNDLLHATRVRDGLYRRVDDPYRIREFFSIESLQEARAEMTAASRQGNRALYVDGGAAVRAWYARMSGRLVDDGEDAST